jgi:hypothetical protein
VKYREPITRGILEWNKAFEKIGFKERDGRAGAARRRRLRHARLSASRRSAG